MKPGLGRLVAKDRRDTQFLLKALLPVEVPRKPRKTWRLSWKGNQGTTSMCVGYGWHGLLRAAPIVQRKPSPIEIYQGAQRNDEWPGEDYEGSSVRGGAKALQASGQIKAYGWAFDVATVLAWLATHGPVVIGTHWYKGMFTPDADGVVTPKGDLAGGHCYLAIGYDDKRGMILCQNSWGNAWGKKGRFYMRYADMDRLIKNDGEACTPTEPVTP